MPGTGLVTTAHLWTQQQKPNLPAASVLAAGTVVPMKEAGRFCLGGQSKNVKKLLKEFLKSTCMPLILWTSVCNYRTKIHSRLSHCSKLGSLGQGKEDAVSEEGRNPPIMQRLVFGWCQMWMGRIPSWWKLRISCSLKRHPLIKNSINSQYQEKPQKI